MNECTICTYQIGKPSSKYEAPIINYRVFLQDNGIVQIIMNKKDYETLNKYAYLGQIQQEIIDNLQSKIDKIGEYIDKIYDVMDYKDYPPYLDDIYYTLHPELKEINNGKSNNN